MENTNKDKNEQINSEKNTQEERVKKIPINITVGHLLLIFLIILIVITGSIVYYMSGIENEVLDDKTAQNVVGENKTIENNDTIKNIIDSSISSNSNNTNTVNTTDANNRKVMNENLIVLYNGLILDTTKMEKKELEYIDNSDKYKDKYVITYYNYENFEFKEAKLGTLSEQVYEGVIKIDNVGKIAISENYDAIPRDIKIVNSIPTSILEKNVKIADFDAKKTIIVDLDGNGTEEYILILANKVSGYSKIALFDSTGVKVADLAYIEKSQWETVTTEEYYLTLSNVNIIDIDNDGTMEILVEIPVYEGEPSISLLKYKNGELRGNTNIECSLLP